MNNYKYLENKERIMNQEGTMNLLGLVFAGVIMFSMIFFGIGVSQTLHDGTNITASDEMYDQYQIATDVTTQGFNFIGYIPYLLIITAVLGALLLLTKLLR